jgi:hypothetical protein
MMKSLLGLVLPLLVAVSALPATAAIMEATYFGRIYQGTDFAGVIGTPGSISESTFTAVYTYDTAFSNRTTSGVGVVPSSDMMIGGSGYGIVGSPILSVLFTIQPFGGGAATSFSLSANLLALVAVSANASEWRPEVSLKEERTGPLGTQYFELNTYMLGASPWFPALLEDGYSYSAAPGGAGGGGSFYFYDYPFSGGRLDRIAGYFDTRSVVISPLTAVPVPASLSLMLAGGLALAGIGRLQRRRSRLSI